MPPVLIALAAAAFASGANLRLFDALLPTVAKDFAVPPTTASVVVTAFTLAYGLFQLVHGPLGDRIGKLRVIGGATLIAAAASLGCALARSNSIERDGAPERRAPLIANVRHRHLGSVSFSR